MVQRFTEDFDVVWEDPGDASYTWLWDRMHNPEPVPPLAFDLVAAVDGQVFGAHSVLVNGYKYSRDSMPPPPTPEVLEKGVSIWDSEFVPRIRETCLRLRTTDYASMSAAQLADALDGIIREVTEAFRYTMIVVFPFMGPTYEMLTFAEKELGEDSDQLIATLLQGYENGSAAAGAGLGELAAFARARPAVAQALNNGHGGSVRDVEGGAEFMARLDAYLDEYGWRAESWGLPHVPTWAEEPGVAMSLIGRYATDSTHDPAHAIERSREQRKEAMREVESRLSGERLEEFKRRFATCERHVPISEGRAQWQLTIIGSARVPLLALGSKLGVLGEPNDVFFLTLEELKAAARSPDPALKEAVARRKADLARWEELSPPAFLGAPPSEPPPAFAGLVEKFFGAGVVPSEDAKVVKGNAASRGTARGRARVIRSLTEANRLQEGDVLVCPSTAPPWTPLFAIAAAVVTDTGGILSHSAICAREYGIPCVVGTQVGTRQIPDGAMVTVDAAEGVVRIEG